jgi:ABC-type glycerol-3-phosphate transport system substrate-binding protein
MREENHWGLVMDEKGSRRIYDDVYPWMWAAGAQFISGGRPAINSRPFIESLTFLASLNNEGLVVKGNKVEDFSLGKAAFMVSSVKDIEFVRERMGEDAFDISTVPVPDNYAGTSYFGSAEWTLGISSTSAHREEAGLFVDFLAERAQFLAGNAGVIPADGGQPSRDHFYSKAWDIAMVWESANEFSGLPWMGLEEIFSEEFSLLFTGESSPSETATAIQRRWEALLLP